MTEYWARNPELILDEGCPDCEFHISEHLAGGSGKDTLVGGRGQDAVRRQGTGHDPWRGRGIDTCRSPMHAPDCEV
jgi:hypothetical protein